MNRNNNSDSKSLSLPPLGKVLDLLGFGAEVASVVDPSGTAGIMSAGVTAVSAVANYLVSKDEERQKERIRLLLEDLRNRVAQLEQTVNPPVELFAEMLTSAIRQDDARKCSLQGAVIAWVAASRPDPALARLAMSAVATLGYPELRSFLTWSVMGGGRLRLERGWAEHVTWSRLLQAGLISQTSVVGTQFITLIGRVLIEGCRNLAYTEQEWLRLQ